MEIKDLKLTHEGNWFLFFFYFAAFWFFMSFIGLLEGFIFTFVSLMAMLICCGFAIWLWFKIPNFNTGNYIRNKEKNMKTNYEKTMLLKREYEDLKKQLGDIKAKMMIVKQKTKDELDWIINGTIDD